MFVRNDVKDLSGYGILCSLILVLFFDEVMFVCLWLNVILGFFIIMWWVRLFWNLLLCSGFVEGVRVEILVL